jgi:hypothetical protein
MNVARDWLKRPVGKGFELCIICLSPSSIILCQRHHNWTLNKFLGDLAFFIQDRVFVFDQLYIVCVSANNSGFQHVRWRETLLSTWRFGKPQANSRIRTDNQRFTKPIPRLVKHKILTICKKQR